MQRRVVPWRVPVLGPQQEAQLLRQQPPLRRPWRSRSAIQTAGPDLTALLSLQRVAAPVGLEPPVGQKPPGPSWEREPPEPSWEPEPPVGQEPPGSSWERQPPGPSWERKPPRVVAPAGLEPPATSSEQLRHESRSTPPLGRLLPGHRLDCQQGHSGRLWAQPAQHPERAARPRLLLQEPRRLQAQSQTLQHQRPPPDRQAEEAWVRLLLQLQLQHRRLQKKRLVLTPLQRLRAAGLCSAVQLRRPRGLPAEPGPAARYCQSQPSPARAQARGGPQAWEVPSWPMRLTLPPRAAAAAAAERRPTGLW